MDAVAATLGLSPEQAERAVGLAATAPSLGERRPWRWHLAPEVIELRADPQRRLPAADPEDRELRLGCGAALFNLRLALEHLGIRPAVELGARPDDPALLAVVRSAGPMDPALERGGLFRSMTVAHPERRPFLETPVPVPLRSALVGAARAEHSWLHVVPRAQRAELRTLVARANERQAADAQLRSESERFGGISGQHDWVLPDLSRPLPVPEIEDDPMVAVVCSHGPGTAVGEVKAGQALQRLLLTAMSLGLVVSTLAQVVEVEETADRLRQLVTPAFVPQAVLRVGYGSPVRSPAAPVQWWPEQRAPMPD